MTDIFENYTQGRNVEYWIKLIHSEKHVESLKSLFPLGEKVSQHAVSICLEGIDRIMNKKNKNIFLCNAASRTSCVKYWKSRGFLFLQ